MRICVQLSTGKILEMQSSATAGTLLANAIGAGFDKGDLEERDVSPDEYESMVMAQTPPEASKPDPLADLVATLLAANVLSLDQLPDSLKPRTQSQMP